VYVYASFNPKAEEDGLLSEKDDYDVAEQIINMSIFHRDPKTRKVVQRTLMQSDPKI